MPLKIAVADHDKIKVLHLNGRLDAATSPPLDSKVHELLESGCHKFVFNFAKVDYLSSAGLRFMLSATKRIKAKGGHLAFCALQADVLDIVKMAGFERMFPIYPDEKRALAALG